MEAKKALARVLLEKVRQDKYPSMTQMEILEHVAPREMGEEYLAVLVEKVARERWPSITMMRHIQRVAEGLEGPR